MPGEEQIQQPAIFNSYTIEKKKKKDSVNVHFASTMFGFQHFLSL